MREPACIAGAFNSWSGCLCYVKLLAYPPMKVYEGYGLCFDLFHFFFFVRHPRHRRPLHRHHPHFQMRLAARCTGA